MNKRVHKFPFAVAYADTDAGGIVYHGAYVAIAERARMDWLNGVSRVGDDVGFVLSELNVKYLAPMRLGDRFVVESTLRKVGAASIDVEQKFVKDDVICAIINLTAAYVGADMRIKRIPDEIKAMLG